MSLLPKISYILFYSNQIGIMGALCNMIFSLILYFRIELPDDKETGAMSKKAKTLLSALSSAA